MAMPAAHWVERGQTRPPSPPRYEVEVLPRAQDDLALAPPISRLASVRAYAGAPATVVQHHASGATTARARWEKDAARAAQARARRLGPDDGRRRGAVGVERTYDFLRRTKGPAASQPPPLAAPLVAPFPERPGSARGRGQRACRWKCGGSKAVLTLEQEYKANDDSIVFT